LFQNKKIEEFGLSMSFGENRRCDMFLLVIQTFNYQKSLHIKENNNVFSSFYRKHDGYIDLSGYYLYNSLIFAADKIAHDICLT